MSASCLRCGPGNSSGPGGKGIRMMFKMSLQTRQRLTEGDVSDDVEHLISHLTARGRNTTSIFQIVCFSVISTEEMAARETMTWCCVSVAHICVITLMYLLIKMNMTCSGIQRLSPIFFEMNCVVPSINRPFIS